MIGSELVGDNCHPTPLGFSIMVRSILETLLASGWLGGGEPQGLAKTDWPAYLAGIPPKEQTQFQIRFHFAEAEYGLDSCPRAGGPYTCPYLMLAVQHLAAAQQLGAKEWPFWFLKAIAENIAGRPAESRTALVRAIHARGRLITRDDLAQDARLSTLVHDGYRPVDWDD